MKGQRQVPSLSISTAVRSSSPSPSPSSARTPTGEGLARRSSWTPAMPQADGSSSRIDFSAPPGPTVGFDTGRGPALPPRAALCPPDESDIGAGWTPEPAGRQPFFHRQWGSEVSLGSSLDDDADDRADRSEIAAAPHLEHDQQALHAAGGTSAERRHVPPPRPYGSDGGITSPAARIRDSIVRSPTLRTVSQSIRKASIRIVHMVGADHHHHHHHHNLDDGGNRMTRLQDEPEEMDEPYDEIEMQEKGDWVTEGMATPRPSPRPPEQDGGLRGRTLCFFTAKSKVRRAMDGILRNTFVEPAILLLIIANAVVLAIQATPGLYEPRNNDGYFRSWEDLVLLVLFCIFTAEIFARMVTTGLILDPERSVRDFLFSPTGVWPRTERKISRARGTLDRNASMLGKHRANWRSTGAGRAPAKQATLLPEAPFERAFHHQKTLLSAQRPFLRHSWYRADLVAVLAFWVTFILALTGQEATATRHIYLFRALSVLRIGRLLAITSGTTTILRSLKESGALILRVTYFVVFAATLFSIIGVQSFRGSLRRECVLTDPNNSTDIISLGQQCGGYLDAATLQELTYLNIDGSHASGLPKGYICPINQICNTTSQNPQGGAQTFDNIFGALVQVVVIGSINTWAPSMYQTMDSDFFSSCLYWISAVIVLNFWLINLVVAVVVNTFKHIRSDTKKSAFGADDKDSDEEEEPRITSKAAKHKPGKLLRFYEKTELFWVALVLVSLVTMATKTSGSSEEMLDLLRKLELGYTLAFDLEMVIRIVAYLPDWRAFLSRPRNNLDLFLAIVSSILQIPAIASDPIASWFSIFVLLRWYRFVLAFPRMKPLLMRVFGSFAGLLNMVIFLFIINFIGAIVAVQLFRGDLQNDQLISFSQPWNSFLGMYQIFSSENWTDVLYAAMDAEFPYVQGWLAAIFLCGWFLFANFIVLQMFVAVINENFEVAEEQKRKQQTEAFMRQNEPPKVHVSWVDRFNPYRLLSLSAERSLPPSIIFPIRQTIGAYNPELRKSSELSPMPGRKDAMRKLLGLKESEKEATLRALRRSRSVRDPALHGDFDDERGLTDLLAREDGGPSADVHAEAAKEQRKRQIDFIKAHPTYDWSLWLFTQRNPIRRWCQACFEPAHGERIFGRPAKPAVRLAVKLVLFLAVVASIVIAAIATPVYRKTYYTKHGFTRGTWFDLVEVAVGMVFVLEAVMKIIADGFIFTPNAYLLSIWNIIDFAILITLLINTTTSLIYLGGLSTVTRALKAFRALRLITLFSRLRDTLHLVLFSGFLQIMDASILMILYLIPFAVWGLNIFSGLLFLCNDDSVSGRSECIGEYSNSPVGDLTFLTPRVWANPTLANNNSNYNFDSFRTAMLILFEIVSLEGWIDVMTSTMNIVGRDIQPAQNNSQFFSLYCLTFNLFGAVIILTLFVSIIIENFSLKSGMALLTAQQRNWVDLKKFMRAQSPSQLPKNKPTFGLRAWCYDRATHKHGYWAKSFTAIYYLHILLLMFEDFRQTVISDYHLDWIFLGLTIIYAIDLLVRFYGLGPKSFRANGWNLFDLFVITGSFATTIPAISAAARGITPDEANTQFQKLFLVSIAFKLVERISSLNQLFKTSVASLPAIGNLFLLWAILFFFFAILDIEVFGLTKLGNNSGSRFQNFYTFSNALVMLAFMSTGEGWNGYMHDYTISYPRCTMSEDYFLTDCGSSPWAFGLFICWNIISMYIFLNMFTGVVVESFAYVYQMPGGATLDREDIRSFKKVWSQFDRDRSGYIKRRDLVPFLAKLQSVFEVRPYPAEYSMRNLLRASIPDRVESASGRLLVVNGVRQAVDVRRVEGLVGQIDAQQVRERRNTFIRLYHEARISSEPGRGISFTSMMFMLAHYKLIDDEKALQLDELHVRRAKVERVKDLVNLDRVRGQLRTLYWRKRFLAVRKARNQGDEAGQAGGDGQRYGMRPIVLDSEPASSASSRSGYMDPFSGQDTAHHPRSA